MSTECKCTNPDGGGTKCPSQHIAVCIRERDGHCYGECIPIPTNYQKIDDLFTHWFEQELNQAVRNFVSNKTDLNDDFLTYQPLTSTEISNYTGRFIFLLGQSNKIYLSFRFQFATGRLGGRQTAKGV